MKKTIMLSIDRELSEQFEAVCAEIGLTAEKAIELFFEAPASSAASWKVCKKRAPMRGATHPLARSSGIYPSSMKIAATTACQIYNAQKLLNKLDWRICNA